jgi:hypothetical protein
MQIMGSGGLILGAIEHSCTLTISGPKLPADLFDTLQNGSRYISKVLAWLDNIEIIFWTELEHIQYLIRHLPVLGSYTNLGVKAVICGMHQHQMHHSDGLRTCAHDCQDFNLAGYREFCRFSYRYMGFQKPYYPPSGRLMFQSLANNARNETHQRCLPT